MTLKCGFQIKTSFMFEICFSIQRYPFCCCWEKGSKEKLNVWSESCAVGKHIFFLLTNTNKRKTNKVHGSNVEDWEVQSLEREHRDY